MAVVIIVEFIPADSVNLVSNYHLEHTCLGITHHLLELWPVVVGACHGLVSILLDDCIAILLAILPAGPELGYDGLYSLVVTAVSCV